MILYFMVIMDNTFLRDRTHGSFLSIVCMPVVLTSYIADSYLTVTLMYVLGFCIEVDLSTARYSLECQGIKTVCDQWTSSTSWVRTIPALLFYFVITTVFHIMSFQC